jgi:Lrp/AsnC family transcriptional regulator, leucine-responsive regulatory protein
LPEVLECRRATGTDCYVMKIVLASMDNLQTLLDKLVLPGSPVTSIVISSPVPGRGIQLGRGPTEDGGQILGWQVGQ